MITGGFAILCSLPARHAARAPRQAKNSFVQDLLKVHFVGSGSRVAGVVVVQHRGIIETRVGVLDGVVIQQLVLVGNGLAAGNIAHIKAGLFVVEVLAHVDLVAVLVLDHNVQTQGLQLLEPKVSLPKPYDYKDLGVFITVESLSF